MSSLVFLPAALGLKIIIIIIVQNKIDKYSKLASTHIFYPFAIETAGIWHEMAIELTQEIDYSPVNFSLAQQVQFSLYTLCPN